MITQECYEIPNDLNDTKRIDDFLFRNKGKKVVVVQGLGFVGAVMSLVCANAVTDEYAVIGIDLLNENSYWKIKSINDGFFPLIADDPKITTFFEKSKIKGNFIATYDPEVYKHADIVIVDINLDVEKITNEDKVLKDFDVCLKGFSRAIETIGNKCREDVLVIVETTVPPGTCEKIVKPIIENKLLSRGLATDKYRLGHSYERVMPGPDYINSIREFPRVYSGCNNESADAVEAFLNTIIDVSKCELTRLAHTNATEMAKVLENSYRAMNISFMIEWSRFAEEAGVDLYKMVNAIRVRDTHSNLMYPGVGVGGYCLTKDPLLASWARKSFFGASFDLDLSINSVSLNDQMPIFAFKRLLEVFGDLKSKKVTFFGVSYRGDVGDTRFTPVEILVNQVLKAGATIHLHDPYISFWEEQSCTVESNVDEILQKNSDLIIISAGHSEYKNSQFILKLLEIEPTNLFDTIGLFNNKQISLLKRKHNISVLGRGDL
jgi:nucleotide sugar dehydrogenase